MKKSGFLLAVGMLIGTLLGLAISNRTVSAQGLESWSKANVSAMLFVKPSFGVFVPSEGNSIGVSWTKDQVVPVLLVKSSFGGFVPIDGTPFGNTWSKAEVRPVIFRTISWHVCSLGFCLECYPTDKSGSH